MRYNRWICVEAQKRLVSSLGIKQDLFWVVLFKPNKEFEINWNSSKKNLSNHQIAFNIDTSNKKEISDFIKELKPNVIVHAASIVKCGFHCETSSKRSCSK